MENPTNLIKAWPRRPGVYQFVSADKTPLYVGKALNLKDRISSYFQKDAPAKVRNLLQEAGTLSYIETGSEFVALLLEARLIKLYRPKYNVIFKDDKSFLYVFISTGEEFPKIFLVRKPKAFLFDTGLTYDNYEGRRGIYYGPFPSAATAIAVVKLLRRIFPFCQQKRIGKRVCFYAHIGLCDPCPAMIIKADPQTRESLKKKYRANILAIKKIFEGNLGQLQKDLGVEMRKYGRRQDFENAALIRDQLAQLTYVTTAKDTTKVFMENSNFYFERQKQATQELLEILKPFFSGLISLNKIECFDISNFGGSEAVGAQIVFIDGVPEKTMYRKYRIQTKGKPNDFAMLESILTRRLKHSEWTYPNLCVIDGGKPQVSTIVAYFQKKSISIPVIGLAKRFERIVILQNCQFSEIRLSKKSSALKLLQQIRDETHRFAITYHRKRRTLTFAASI